MQGQPSTRNATSSGQPRSSRNFHVAKAIPPRIRSDTNAVPILFANGERMPALVQEEIRLTSSDANPL